MIIMIIWIHVWTRIFHVRPLPIGETRFLFWKSDLRKVGVATYFIFILKGK